VVGGIRVFNPENNQKDHKRWIRAIPCPADAGSLFGYGPDSSGSSLFQVIFAPQLPQNFIPAMSGLPQDGQNDVVCGVATAAGTCTGVPQSPQNFVPGFMVVPQPGQTGFMTVVLGGCGDGGWEESATTGSLGGDTLQSTMFPAGS